ncbi:Mbeg1-like protein, partial [Thermophilibacter provencensis]
MADVRDYMELRGDITLAKRPFNDVDNLVLATLSYLDFTGVVGGPDEPGTRLTDACGELLARSGGDLASRVRSLATIDERFVVAAGGSSRFGDALLRDYVDVRDDERVIQFSAVTADLDNGETYVAFRGTDTTLVGWRENFVLSFAVTQAQRAAADYLARELERAAARGCRVHVGGHSKGG